MITHPETGETICFGRARPAFELPRLRMDNYTLRKLPPPPPKATYGPPAVGSLSQMYLNNRLSCCVPAALYHALGVITANNLSGEVIASDTDIETFYSQVSPYVPGQPGTDQGTNEVVALNRWERDGLGVGSHQSHKCVGHLRIDGSDVTMVRTAIWLFENVIFGVELPSAWVTPFPKPGFLWGIAGNANPENGHAFMGFGYDSSARAIDVATWGITGKLTEGACESYAIPAVYGEVHTVLTHEIIGRAKLRAPNGFDFSQLLADFESMR